VTEPTRRGLYLLARLVRRLRGDPPVEVAPPETPGAVAFTCNLCGTANRVPPEAIARETPACRTCRSTVRLRSIVQLLVHELLDHDAVLATLAPRRDLVGLGLSDDWTYAGLLAEKFAYTNTHFHKEPRLDITRVPRELEGRHHFVVCSDVLEHVVPPVSRAFDGARRLLRDDGVFVFSVPFSLAEDTREHFPELFDFSIDRSGSEPVLRNRTEAGTLQEFRNLVFHGGDGETLEMREFSRQGLMRELAAAGFSRVRLADESVPAYGIAWPGSISAPVVARP
jgi:hypothetical protein